MISEDPIFVMDTHPLVWHFTNNPRLSSPAKEAFNLISTGEAVGIIPSIVLAEIIHLADSKRVPVSIEKIIADLQQSTNFGIVSLDLSIIILMIPLKSYELYDRVMVATTQSFGASLITKDEQIRKSRTVNCIW
jgi:PIN domain nuclease of toxin-antitoxin system